MAQQPILLDALQIVGDSGVGTRLVESNSLGALVFQDSQVASATLHQLFASLASVSRVYVVASDGVSASLNSAGLPMTTIQMALDEVPDSSSSTNPSLILVAPGTYVEDLRVVKDGVTIRGLGAVTLREASSNTLTFIAGATTVPRRARLEGLTLINTQPTGVCLLASTERFSTGSVTLAVQPSPGDTVSVGGVSVTATCTTPLAAGQFLVGASLGDTAVNLAAALNAEATISGLVGATASGAVVSLQADSPGVAGDAITLATSVPATFVLSGATLTGGQNASAGSDLFAEQLDVVDCSLQAQGATGFQTRMDAVGNVHFHRVSCLGSSTGSTFSVTQCARVEMVHVTAGQILVFGYTTAGSLLPSTAPTTYRILFSDFSNSSALYLTGTSEIEVRGSRFGVLSVAGGQPIRFLNSDSGALSVYDTAQVALRESQYTTLAGDATATVSESGATGTLSFSSSSSESVVFPVPQPDDDYVVSLASGIVPAAFADVPTVVAQSATGFTVNFPIAQTGTVRWSLTRKVV